MNGLSDVRLLLRSQELQAFDAQGRRVRTAPDGLGFWGLMWHRLTTRRALLDLDADQLRDIGLSPREAREEGAKPFWRE
ncbi:DUF1127 domain-containing protein [Pseudomonas silvicola]|nr:DUF1127 domain-containing protein [Pseudomonas silvicola]